MHSIPLCLVCDLSALFLNCWSQKSSCLWSLAGLDSWLPPCFHMLFLICIAESCTGIIIIFLLSARCKRFSGVGWINTPFACCMDLAVLKHDANNSFRQELEICENMSTKSNKSSNRSWKKKNLQKFRIGRNFLLIGTCKYVSDDFLNKCHCATYVFTQSVGKECVFLSWLNLFIRLMPGFSSEAFLLPVWGVIPPS